MSLLIKSKFLKNNTMGWVESHQAYKVMFGTEALKNIIF